MRPYAVRREYEPRFGLRGIGRILEVLGEEPGFQHEFGRIDDLLSGHGHRIFDDIDRIGLRIPGRGRRGILQPVEIGGGRERIVVVLTVCDGEVLSGIVLGIVHQRRIGQIGFVGRVRQPAVQEDGRILGLVFQHDRIGTRDGGHLLHRRR